MAPFMPFLSESVYQNLVRKVDTGAALSVHMASWPTVEEAKCDETLIHDIEVVQQVVGLGRTARNDTGLRVRQPLSRLLVRLPSERAMEATERHRQQILEELNVKTLEGIAQDAELVSYRIKPNLPRIGKRYGKLVPAIREALAGADGGLIAAAAASESSFDIDVNGETISFAPEDVLIETTSAEGYACAEEGGYLVGLDTRLTDDLRIEGLARELIRTVQDARKQAGFEVSDRIVLRIDGSPSVDAALGAHRKLIMSETLATDWGEKGFEGSFSMKHELDDNHWAISLARVT